ncbi:MAG: glycosyltransferase family 2 protein [Lachnospiraceae bacterium]|nr:glycosyltransferase family 2 protein [Lachnospiraceae bacterium]
MDCRLSIIIAIDDEDTDKIKKSIDSALAQDKADTDIIICADSCSEDAKKLLSGYEKKENVKIFYTCEKRGRGGAFNLGIRKSISEKEAKNEFLCFVNAGDTLAPVFADKLLKKAIDSNADIVSCRDNSAESGTDAAVFSEAVKMDSYEKHALLSVNPGNMESKIYKRSIFDKNGLWFPENLSCEKMGINRLALLCSENFDFTDEELYFFDKEKKEISEEELYDRMDVMTYFMEECYKREFLEEFPEEAECAFADDMYVKTLFAYIASTPAKKRKISFLEMLKEGILDCFPEFETNPYYFEKYDDDIKDLISLHIESPKKFLKLINKDNPL